MRLRPLLRCHLTCAIITVTYIHSTSFIYCLSKLSYMLRYILYLIFKAGLTLLVPLGRVWIFRRSLSLSLSLSLSPSQSTSVPEMEVVRAEVPAHVNLTMNSTSMSENVGDPSIAFSLCTRVSLAAIIGTSHDMSDTSFPIKERGYS